MTSPQWLKHLKGAIFSLDGVTDSLVASLNPGEVMFWGQRSTEQRYTVRPQQMMSAPLQSARGRYEDGYRRREHSLNGETKTARRGLFIAFFPPKKRR